MPRRDDVAEATGLASSDSLERDIYAPALSAVYDDAVYPPTWSLLAVARTRRPPSGWVSHAGDRPVTGRMHTEIRARL
jgi:hypothetical protein